VSRHVVETARFLRAAPAEGFRLPPGRMYLGDEFCERRLPSDGLLAWLEQAGRNIGAVTLMTPFLTDRGMARLQAVLARMSRAFPKGFEVVVNDLGTLELLRQSRYPGLEPVCGRLLSSRYGMAPTGVNVVVSSHCMYSEDFPEEFLLWLSEHGMRRVEINSIAQFRQTHQQLRSRGFKTHFHWPYMFLGATRLCEADQGFQGNARDSISGCSQGCEMSLGTSACPDGTEIIISGNAYLVRHEGLAAPPAEADRIVEHDLDLERNAP